MLSGKLIFKEIVPNSLISRFSIPPLCKAALTNRLMLFGYECQQLRMKDWMGNVMSRERKTDETKWRKEMKSLNGLSSKLRVGIESHSGFHLFERMVVDAADLVGRKERM
jgi:hypothetical protein